MEISEKTCSNSIFLESCGAILYFLEIMVMCPITWFPLTHGTKEVVER